MTVSNQPDHQVVDLSRALHRVAGDEQMLRELIEIFLKESPGWLEQVESSVGRNEADGVFRAAHDLKGSTEVFCAEPAARVAQQLEQMGREGDLEGAEDALGALKAELTWVRNALEEYLGEG